MSKVSTIVYSKCGPASSLEAEYYGDNNVQLKIGEEPYYINVEDLMQLAISMYSHYIMIKARTMMATNIRPKYENPHSARQA